MSFVYLQKHIQENWGKILFIGGVYIALGLLAVTYSVVATLVSVSVLAASLVVAGIFELIFSFQTRKEGRFWYHVVFGAVALLCGFFVFMAPVVNMVAISLAIAIFLLTRGLIQAAGSIFDRYPNWGWTLLAGVIDIILGGTILYTWPLSSFWMLGVFVGVSLLLYGSQLIGLAAFGRRSKRVEEITKPSVTPRVPPREERRDQDQHP